MIWAISWRNVWRNRLRSSVIILAIAFGLLGGIFSYAFMIGMSNQGVTSAIKTELANIQLHHPDFVADKDIRYRISDADKIASDIAALPGVAALGIRVKSSAMASTAETSAGIIINGINPENEKNVSDLYTKLIGGKYLQAGDKIPMLISEKLAERLDAKLLSKIVVSVTNVEQIITYGAFRVVGIFKTTDSNFDLQNVFVTAADMRKLVGVKPTEATEIAVLLEERTRTDEVTRLLRTRYPQLSVRPWSEISPALQALAKVSEQFAYFFLLIILLALAFGIINTMLMVVMERTREIGMLMSVGMTGLRIFLMVVYETILLSLTGGILGVLLSLVVITFYGARGINLDIVGEGINSLGYSAVIYPELAYSFYITISFMVIITAVLAAIYPAVKALRLKPAEATRAET